LYFVIFAVDGWFLKPPGRAWNILDRETCRKRLVSAGHLHQEPSIKWYSVEDYQSQFEHLRLLWLGTTGLISISTVLISCLATNLPPVILENCQVHSISKEGRKVRSGSNRGRLVSQSTRKHLEFFGPEGSEFEKRVQINQ
jgi:hypothetical protein